MPYDDRVARILENMNNRMAVVESRLCEQPPMIAVPFQTLQSVKQYVQDNAPFEDVPSAPTIAMAIGIDPAEVESALEQLDDLGNIRWIPGVRLAFLREQHKVN